MTASDDRSIEQAKNGSEAFIQKAIETNVEGSGHWPDRRDKLLLPQLNFLARDQNKTMRETDFKVAVRDGMVYVEVHSLYGLKSEAGGFLIIGPMRKLYGDIGGKIIINNETVPEANEIGFGIDEYSINIWFRELIKQYRKRVSP